MDIRKTAVICAAVMLTACGGQAVSQPAQTQEQTITEKAETVSSAEEVSSSSETETEAETTVSLTVTEAEETAAPDEEKPLTMPQYAENNVEDGTVNSDDEEDAVLLNYDYSSIVIENEDEYPELAKAVADHYDERHRIFTDEKNSYADLARENYTDSPERFTGKNPEDPDNNYAMSYSLSYSSTVSQSDEKIFSFTDCEFGYAGGVHGGELVLGMNFDSQTGKQLTLSDICTDIPRLIDILADKLESDYGEWIDPAFTGSSDYREILTNVYGEDLQGYTELYEGTEYEHGGLNFVFFPDGIYFFTNQYDIAAYAYGRQKLTLLFTEAEGLFNEKYVTVGRNYVIKGDFADMYADLDGDGKGDIISFDFVQNEDWEITGGTVKALGKEYTFEIPPEKYAVYGVMQYPELERRDGKFIYRMIGQDGEVLFETEL